MQAHGEGTDGEEASWLKVAAVAGSLVLTVAVFGYMVIVMKRETKMITMGSYLMILRMFRLQVWAIPIPYLHGR